MQPLVPRAEQRATMPNVESKEPYWRSKQRAMESQQLGDEPHYEPIHRPPNSPIGAIAAFFATFVVFAWRDEKEYEIPAEEVAHIDRHRPATRQAWLDANGGAVAKEVA